MYWGFRAWLQKIGRYGHSVSFVETSDLDAVRAAVRPGETGLFWIETPSNPLWTITDIAAIAEIAHDADAVLCVDFDRRDADVHPADRAWRRHRHASATKYLNGHSDVVAGALGGGARQPSSGSASARCAAAERRPARPVRGLAVDARHAHARCARREQARTAAMLAARLAEHPALSALLYPGLRAAIPATTSPYGR